MSIGNTPIVGIDLTGFRELETGLWGDEAGLVMSVHFFSAVPDLPAPLSEQERLQAACARHVAMSGGGLIEAVVATVDGVAVLRQLIKIPRPDAPSGQVFIGSWTAPRATCSTVVRVQAVERGTTGLRESMVGARVGLNAASPPHPYAAGAELGGLPYLVADHEQWDPQFPNHPLTLVRAALNRLAPTIRLDDRFKAMPPFSGPARDQNAPDSDSGQRQRVNPPSRGDLR